MDRDGNRPLSGADDEDLRSNYNPDGNKTPANGYMPIKWLGESKGSLKKFQNILNARLPSKYHEDALKHWSMRHVYNLNSNNKIQLKATSTNSTPWKTPTLDTDKKLPPPPVTPIPPKPEPEPKPTLPDGYESECPPDSATTSTNRKGYVLYDSNYFGMQAKSESAYLQSLKSIDTVETKGMITSSKFLEVWRNIKNENRGSKKIDVSLIFHGDATNLYAGPGSNQFTMDLAFIKGLPNISIKTLRILSCNAGHKDVKDNVASAFKSLGGIEEIYASDGNLSFYNPFTGAYELRLSTPRNQGGFEKYASNVVIGYTTTGYPVTARREPIGWYRYS